MRDTQFVISAENRIDARQKAARICQTMLAEDVRGQQGQPCPLERVTAITPQRTEAFDTRSWMPRKCP